MARKYLPDLKYLPDNLTEINSKTLLTKGVSLGVYTPNTDLNHIKSLEERKQIVRNLLPQAHILQYVKNNKSTFSDYRLKVMEGIYKKHPTQKLTGGGILDLQTKGRAVVYELQYNGTPDIDKTVELAYNLLVTQRHFDKIILNYDTYSPTRELNVQLIIIMPEIPSNYNVTFKREFETLYNNVSFGQELIKIEK